MDKYLNLVENVLENGTYEQNRTKEETIATFSQDYSIDVGSGYPLLTTKQMDTFRWDSMLHELEWYLSGRHHIRELTEKTGIWDAWSDENNNLPSAYGRFWRRYPVPEDASQLPGEAWITEDSRWTNYETPVDVEFAFSPDENNVLERATERLEGLGNGLDDTTMYFDKPTEHITDDYRKVNIPMTLVETDSDRVAETVKEIERNVNPYRVETGESYLTYDQLKFNVDALKGENPHRGPESRRLIVQAWHPSNAQVSTLPPCHYTFLFNVQGGKLNLHLTQRSADIALGVPFNIAAYSLILKLVAQETGFEVGSFSHTLADAHIYCGHGVRSEWYQENLAELQRRVSEVNDREDYRAVRDWIVSTAPNDPEENADNHNYGYDHVPGLLEQLSREPKSRSNLRIDDGTTIENATYDDFKLKNYESYDGIGFSVAE